MPATQRKALEKDKAVKTPPLSESFFRVWLPTLVVALFIITFVVQPFDIPSSSMEPTLLIGDHLLADRVALAPPAAWTLHLVPYRPLQHGDSVVFMSQTQPGMHLVKRLMGLPGDHIKLVHGVVYRNGQALNEPYAHHIRGYEPTMDDWPNGGPLLEATQEWLTAMPQYVQNGEVVVPAKSYFMMGDNRDDSYDSRYWGFVPEADLIGRPDFIYWSYGSEQESEDEGGLANRVGGLIDELIHAPVRTRWTRTFHLIR